LLSTAQLLHKQHNFAKRKYAIDAQYRGRLAGVGAFATSGDIQGLLLLLLLCFLLLLPLSRHL